MGVYQAWTTSDCEALRAFAAAGLDLSVIARKLGRTRESVRRKAKHLGVALNTRPAVKWSDSDDLVLLAGLGLKRPISEIAETLGRSENAVYARIRKFRTYASKEAKR